MGSDAKRSFGGYWTRAKLDILRKYLAAFNRASTRANATVYLDLFAGSLWNRDKQTSSTFKGSTGIALDTSPRFTKLIFWELPGPAKRLRQELTANYLRDDRWSVVEGDCNSTLDRGLASVRDLRWAPTFAFIDPMGLQTEWETLDKLSKWRQGKTKTELWLLFPEPAFERVLGLAPASDWDVASQLTALYGSEEWLGIHQRRKKGLLSPDETRAEYVNLMRWRLERVLGYRKTLPLALCNVSGHPVYTMIFATDHQAGRSIMEDVYGHADVHEIPALRSQALALRERKRQEAKGLQRLFDVEPVVDSAAKFDLVEPWAPPAPFSEPDVSASN